jgi:hypothetical protein
MSGLVLHSHAAISLMAGLHRQVGEKIWAQAPEGRNLTQMIHHTWRQNPLPHLR